MNQFVTARARREPLPIPSHPYDRETLSAYVYEHVSVHVKDDVQSRPFEQRITEWMWRQPAWVQVLLVENKVTFEVGARKKTGLPRDAVADAEAETYHVRRIIRQMDELESNLSHEVGHVIDNILANHMKLRGETKHAYYSDASVGYRRALVQDRQGPVSRAKRDLNRGLREHLSHKIYKPKDYPNESFAYLFDHYLMLHHAGKSEEEIDGRMNHYLPTLWPHFRDKMLPVALQLAGDEYGRRKQAQSHSLEMRVEAMEQAVDAAIQTLNVAPLNDAWTIHQLAAGMQCEQWLERFAWLAEGATPKEPYKRIYALFGDRFDSMEMMMETLHRDPALKREARRMVMQLEDTLEQKGLDGFVRGCMAVQVAFERAEARGKSAQQSR